MISDRLNPHWPLQPSWRDNVFTASDLRAMTFKSIDRVVPGIIPEGLTILPASPR